MDGAGFLPRNNPILRHTVLRKRANLEDMDLLDRIAVDIWPSEHERLPMFEGLALHTSAEFDVAYSQFTQKKQRANAFDLRYGTTVMPEGPGWELCEKVLARRDVVERLSVAW